MINKAPFCIFLLLTRTILSRLQIKTCPMGLHNFAFLVVVLHFSLSTFNCFGPLAPNVIVRKYLPLYICRDKITDVMSALQIHLFMQNKANFRKSQVNVTAFITMNYVQMDTWSIEKNKPKTNPIQSQFNPNTKPIRTQFKPKQTQFHMQKSSKDKNLKFRQLPILHNNLSDIWRLTLVIVGSTMAVLTF